MKLLKSILLILGSMVITSLLIACGSSAEPAPSSSSRPTDSSEVPRISPEELKGRLDDGEGILVIDMRSRRVYDSGHIPGAIMKPKNFNDLAHEQAIVVYGDGAHNADTSARLAATLYIDGFTDVSALLGGYGAWLEADYPVEET